MEFNATFLVSVISFLLFVEIMNRIFYMPLTNIAAERKELLDANYSDAKNFDDAAESILQDREIRLNEAETQSRKMISDGIENENSKGKILTDEASKRSQITISNRKNTLMQEKEALQAELETRVNNLAETIASKITGTDVKIRNEEAQLNGVV